MHLRKKQPHYNYTCTVFRCCIVAETSLVLVCVAILVTETVSLPFYVHTVPKTCTISEPLQISPFNGNSKYSLKGTCEYIALSSCDGSPDFSVTVDFLTGSLENGAIGITKDGQHWISREDGTIESSAVISNTSPDGDGNIVISYRGQNVLGIIGSGFNRLEVADGINVVVTHQYGKQCMSFALTLILCVCVVTIGPVQPIIIVLMHTCIQKREMPSFKSKSATAHCWKLVVSVVI